MKTAIFVDSRRVSMSLTVPLLCKPSSLQLSIYWSSVIEQLLSQLLYMVVGNASL